MINQLSNFYKCFHKTKIVKESSLWMKIQQTRLEILILSMNLTKFLQTEQKQKVPN